MVEIFLRSQEAKTKFGEANGERDGQDWVARQDEESFYDPMHKDLKQETVQINCLITQRHVTNQGRERRNGKTRSKFEG